MGDAARVDLDAIAERGCYYRDEGLPNPRYIVSTAERDALVAAVRAARMVPDWDEVAEALVSYANDEDEAAVDSRLRGEQANATEYQRRCDAARSALAAIPSLASALAPFGDPA